MMLVGDSIMRNQWESLVCLVEDAIPPEKKMVSYNGSSMAFHALVRFVSVTHHAYLRYFPWLLWERMIFVPLRIPVFNLTNPLMN